MARPLNIDYFRELMRDAQTRRMSAPLSMRQFGKVEAWYLTEYAAWHPEPVLPEVCVFGDFTTLDKALLQHWIDQGLTVRFLWLLGFGNDVFPYYDGMQQLLGWCTGPRALPVDRLIHHAYAPSPELRRLGWYRERHKLDQVYAHLQARLGSLGATDVHDLIVLPADSRLLCMALARPAWNLSVVYGAPLPANMSMAPRMAARMFSTDSTTRTCVLSGRYAFDLRRIVQDFFDWACVLSQTPVS